MSNNPLVLCKCDQLHRLDTIEKSIDVMDTRIIKAEDALNDGNSRFIRLEYKLESVFEKLGELSDTIKAATRWALGIFGTAALGWVIVNMGKGGP